MIVLDNSFFDSLHLLFRQSTHAFKRKSWSQVKNLRSSQANFLFDLNNVSTYQLYCWSCFFLDKPNIKHFTGMSLYYVVVSLSLSMCVKLKRV